MNGGREAWLKKAPYLPEKERERIEGNADAKVHPIKAILAIARLAAIPGLAIYFMGPRLLIPLAVVCVSILPVSIYTMVTARNRYHAWVEQMIDAYMLDAEKLIGITRMTEEEHLAASARDLCVIRK